LGCGKRVWASTSCQGAWGQLQGLQHSETDVAGLVLWFVAVGLGFLLKFEMNL